jgi:redox-sensing transcriptional repressor
VKEREVSIGIVATTAAAAQDAADRLVSAGVKSILNFAPTVLTVPDDVSMRKVDLSIELQILSYYEQRKSAMDAVARPARLKASASRSTRP